LPSTWGCWSWNCCGLGNWLRLLGTTLCGLTIRTREMCRSWTGLPRIYPLSVWTCKCPLGNKQSFRRHASTSHSVLTECRMGDFCLQWTDCSLRTQCQ
jgi:hypothetical protein